MFKSVFFLLGMATIVFANEANIIGGVEVSKAGYPEIVVVRSWSDDGLKLRECTGVLVGPRVILSGAFCIGNNTFKAEVKFNGRLYKGKPIPHPKFPEPDIDLALIVLNNRVMDVEPISIGTKIEVGQSISIFGYGSTHLSQSPSFNVLRRAQTNVGELLTYDFSFPTWGKIGMGGGDAGSPAYLNQSPSKTVIGVGSKITTDPATTNYYARTDTMDALRFFESVSTMFEVEICGISVQCNQN